MSNNLTYITEELGKWHATSKESKKELDKRKDEFFDAITDHLNVNKSSLSSRTVLYPHDLVDISKVEEWVKTYHPGWVMVSHTLRDYGIVLQIQEDPAFKKFVYINPRDKKVYQRNVVQDPTYLDTDKLKEDHPDVWLKITEPIEHPGEDLLLEFCTGDLHYAAKAWIEQRKKSVDWPRNLVDLENVTDQDLSVVGEYMIPGKLKLRLESPRKATTDELEEFQDQNPCICGRPDRGLKCRCTCPECLSKNLAWEAWGSYLDKDLVCKDCKYTVDIWNC